MPLACWGRLWLGVVLVLQLVGTDALLPRGEALAQATGGSWTGRAPMPTARYGLGVAAASNGKLYAIGGYNSGSGYLNRVEEYDPGTNTWTNCGGSPTNNLCRSMPTPRYGLGVAAASNGKLYAIGGFNDSSGYLDRVEEYDPATNTWTNCGGSPTNNLCRSMPTIRFGLGVAAANNGRLYAIGGYNPTSLYLTRVEEYNPAANTWATVSNSLPAARTRLAVAAASNGLLYAVGGDDVDHVFAETYEFDPTYWLWAPRPPMPTARSGLGAAGASNGMVYAIGGLSGSYLNTVEEYDPLAERWLSRPSMPTARWFLGVAAASNGKLYAIGGQNAGGYLTTVEEYTPPTTPLCTDPLPPPTAIEVQTSPAGRAIVTVTAHGNARVLRLRFGDSHNALIDIPSGPTGSPGNFTYTYPTPTRQVNFVYREVRVPPPAQYTVTLFVTDDCGESGPYPIGFDGNGAGTATTLATNVTTAVAGGSITASWRLGSEAPLTAPWMALYRASDPDGATPAGPVRDLAPATVGGTGTATYNLPAGLANGKYNLRVFANKTTGTLLRYSETIDVTGVSCAPRPNIGVATVANGDGRLRVTITANTNPGSAVPNTLQSVQFTRAPGAALQEANGVSINVPGPANLPAGATSYQFFVRPTAPGTAATAFLTITDGCSPWDTFAGGGPSVFGAGGSSGDSAPTPTPGPTGVPSPAAAAPTPVPAAICTPRPTIAVTTTPGGAGRLRVTVAAPAAAHDTLQALRFGSAINARIDVGGQAGLTGNVTVPLPPSTQQLTFDVTRVTAGQAVTVPLTVVDSCGEWPTLVGGGAETF